MNTANIKKYAPKARNNFIAAVTKQAARYGITAKGTESMEQRGDIALIGEKAFPKAIAPARKALERMVNQMGFAQAMEQAAYSWFNRLCAIRYMEVHDFLDHGRRVLSTANGDGGTPQILDDCLDISLPGLDPQQVAELKLDGNKDEELYRELLLAQCHALHEAMPFLFEAVDDATELLLPDNLTKTDSLIRELVSAIPEDDWQDVEIIGWLYQFYISDRKEEVTGKVIRDVDIPAATQLFTPNWIVQYLIQNSVGRQWLQTYPDSPLRNQMPYFIEPGEQPPGVQAHLAETVPDAIDPESIKVLDPACGSGHILVEAYKILKAIYEERGYRSRDIPQQILKHNLFGLDIDDRAGQLAGFALMMLAREDDRRLFSRVAEGDVTLNVLSLKETGHLDLPQLWRDLNLSGDWHQGSSQSLFESDQSELSSASADERYQLLQRTLERFVEAKTFGSLIEVPEEDAVPLKTLVDELEQLARTGDVMQTPAAITLLPNVRQAWILAERYEVVIANPPYMGQRYFCKALKKFADSRYLRSKYDLFAMFMERSLSLLSDSGLSAQVTLLGWMYLSNYEKLRRHFLSENTIIDVYEIGYSAFKEVSVGVSTSIIKGNNISGYRSTFRSEISKKVGLRDFNDFSEVLGALISLDMNQAEIEVFKNYSPIGENFDVRQGLSTSDDPMFVRYWFEISSERLSVFGGSKWFPFNKGGGIRKWYGNNYHVINWENSGSQVKSLAKSLYGSYSRTIKNESYYFRPGVTWGRVSGDSPTFRYFPEGSIFSDIGCAFFSSSNTDLFSAMGILNSSFGKRWLRLQSKNPKVETGHVKSIPWVSDVDISDIVSELIFAHKEDWDSWELSSEFDRLWSVSDVSAKECFKRKYSEECYKLQSAEFKEKIIEDKISSAFGLGKVAEAVPTELLRSQDLKSFTDFRKSFVLESVSYAIGCLMGRYSTFEKGLIYASTGSVGLERILNEGRYGKLEPDTDGILPISDQEWFSDDATNRFREFVRVVWGDEHLQENLDFVAESLCLHAIKPKRGESAMDTIRRYLSTQFFKDHLRTYKKRPIYWLFSSGKHKAFECLVYLHRYNEGTLARMRTEYVIPLSAKLNAYAEKLEQDKEASTSAAETKRLEKEIATLHKQQAELAEFDEKLRHFADQRISLDLDEGVKVNYGKFGDLLAEVKAVTGEKPR